MTSDKRQTLDNMLAGGAVMIRVDATRPYVIVPAALKDRVDLVLAVGYDLHTPIRDLRTDDLGITATLLFGALEVLCHIPWTALYAAQSDFAPVYWPDSVPSGVQAPVEHKIERHFKLVN